MTSVKASLSSVLAKVKAEIETEAKEAAGSNTLIAKSEESKLKDSVTKTTATEIRAQGGPGTTVTVDALVTAASSKMNALIGSVNQATGSGATTVSQAEVKALAAQDLDAGKRVARAYEMITGKAIDLGGVAPVTPTPTPDANLGELNTVRAKAIDLVYTLLDEHAGTNDVFNAEERASLPSGFVKDAAYETPPPRSVHNITGFLMNKVDVLLQDSGFDIGQVGHLDGPGTALLQLPFPRSAFVKLVENDAAIAGLFADALLLVTGTRPDVAGLPPVKFTAVTPPPTPTGPVVVNGIPGAVGAVTFIDPAKVDVLETQLVRLIPMMDLSNNGVVSLAEAQSFVKRATNGYFPDNPVNIEPFLRSLYFAREAVYQRIHTSPTPAQILDEVRARLVRVKELGSDENNWAFDLNGKVDLEDERVEIGLYDAARSGHLDLATEPFLRFFDHFGDFPVDKRPPLDLSGSADKAVRNLVFHFNQAGNDNHWPLWSGRATSRYRLDVDEVSAVVARLKQEPATRQRELFDALVAWTDRFQLGYVYFEEAARPMLDELAIALGSPARFPPGTWSAPSMPSP